jgi:copper chaperone NosL
MQYSFLLINKLTGASSSGDLMEADVQRSMKKLSTVSRILMAILSLCVITVYYVPAWRIDLFAPQYPEGLVLKIWLNTLAGDVDVINGLNHYIGMKKLSVEMFPEFKYLVYLVGAFIVYGLAIAITGSRRLLLSYLAVSAVGGLLAMYDFYQWGYDYGHNLNPEAPIKVPGMGYQPPLIGHKKLMNFDAYSMPDIGGYVVVAVVVIAAVIWFVEYRKSLKAV